MESDKKNRKAWREVLDKIVFNFFSFIHDWQICFSAVLRPFFVAPVTLAVLALCFANKTGIDKNYSILLQILATILVGVAGSFVYDFIKNNLEKSMLLKKG